MAASHFDLNGFLRDKILAALIALGVYYLQTISHELQDLGKTLAVAVARVDEHERRLTALEQEVNDRQEAGPRRDR